VIKLRKRTANVTLLNRSICASANESLGAGTLG
jgi:hypothetical protein